MAVLSDMTRFIVLIGAVLCLLAPIGAGAQSPPEAVAPELESNEPKEINPYDEDVLELIPDEFFEEAENMKRYCTDREKMSNYYDCTCFAERFFEERVKQGPDVSWHSIMMDLRPECRDASFAAAERYRECIGQPLMIPDNADPVDFCTCYANRFAKLFETTDARLGDRLLVDLQSRASRQCSQPYR